MLCAEHGILTLLLTFWTVFLDRLGSPAPPREPTIPDIVNAWSAREKRVVSATFEWDLESFAPKGSRPFNYIEDHQLKTMPYPPEDTKYEFPYRLKFQGIKMRRQSPITGRICFGSIRSATGCLYAGRAL